MKYLEIFEQYQQKYQSAKNKKPYPYTKQISFNKACNILFFEGQGYETFLIVPSIFNSHEILTIDAPNNMVTNLRKMGSVYLIEWLEVDDKDFGLADYAVVVAEVLKAVVCFPRTSHAKIRGSQEAHEILASSPRDPIHLIGHCLGGSLSVAASLIHQEYVGSLILLTTPWNFGHLLPAKTLYDSLELAKAVEGLDHIPAIYMQILFFLLSPESLEQKLDFYQANCEDIDNSNFFEIERWQFSGHPIPRKAYDDLMDGFIDDNILAKGLWSVDGIVIDPGKLLMPVMIVVGKKDKLVPKSSCGILSSLAKVFEYNSGHIGYLVGSQRERFMRDLKEWISK